MADELTFCGEIMRIIDYYNYAATVALAVIIVAAFFIGIRGKRAEHFISDHAAAIIFVVVLVLLLIVYRAPNNKTKEK